MASCHTHATIIHIHRRVWHLAIPTLPLFTSIGGYGILPYPRRHRSHIHAPIIPTYSVSGVRGYGRMPYPPKNATAIISGVRGYGRMPYPPKLPFCFGVRDAGVINRLETLDEHELGEGDVAEGDRTLLEESLVDIAVDDAVDERRDALLRVLHE